MSTLLSQAIVEIVDEVVGIGPRDDPLLAL